MEVCGEMQKRTGDRRRLVAGRYQGGGRGGQPATATKLHYRRSTPKNKSTHRPSAVLRTPHLFKVTRITNFNLSDLFPDELLQV